MIKTQSAAKKAFTIKPVNGEFRVFDAQQRYRCKFETRQAAEDYINGGREATPARPFPATEANL